MIALECKQAKPHDEAPELVRKPHGSTKSFHHLQLSHRAQSRQFHQQLSIMSGRNAAAAPRPRRAGDQFARGNRPDADERSPKKPRFDYRNPSTLVPDAPEEDAILELDEIGKGGQQTKRSAVNLDGYESDSSNENFDARAVAKADASRRSNGKQVGKSEMEEENDMFAEVDEGMGDADGDADEELPREGKQKKKDVRFLDVDEIQGQVNSSKSGGHVSSVLLSKGKAATTADVESSSESGGDEERDRIDSDVDEELGAGAKKKHAPKLDAFNMKAEGEEGRFDESGNFVRKAADPDAVHDSWLEGLSKKDMKRAREAQEKREEDRRKRNMADDAFLTGDLLRILILRLDKGETTLEALQRLGKGKDKKKKPKWQKNKKKNGEEMDMGEDGPQDAEDPAEQRRRETVEAITDAADRLLTRGQTEIYDVERELLMRQYQRETGEEWSDRAVPDADANGAADTRDWEYRWSDARDGGERHGPYDGNTMHAWNQAGYFGDGVEFRRLGDVEWSRSVDFV